MSATRTRALCVNCGQSATHHVSSPYCKPCRSKIAAEQLAAILAVRKAVRRGDLWHPKLRRCVDCGQQAHDYDHREYAKPLQVEPVCRRCNILRGPAIPFASRPPAAAA